LKKLFCAVGCPHPIVIPQGLAPGVTTGRHTEQGSFNTPFGAGIALFVGSAQICPTTYTFAAMPNRRKVSSGGIVPSVSMIGQVTWQSPLQSAVEYNA
jgi:hypothetical protein